MGYMKLVQMYHKVTRRLQEDMIERNESPVIHMSLFRDIICFVAQINSLC